MADLSVDFAVAQLRERFATQGHAKLQQLSDDVEKSEQNLHALVCEFETRSLQEAERVEREVEARRKSGATPAAEQALVITAERSLNGVLERLPATRDVGPGWKI